VAFLDRRDRNHKVAADFFRSWRGDLVTNVAALTEATHLLNAGSGAARDLVTWVSSGIEVDEGTSRDLDRIVSIMTKYSDLPTDFADASLIAMCERRKIGRIATLDKGFAIYQLANRRRLHNVLAQD
jgi:hypothetical protein